MLEADGYSTDLASKLEELQAFLQTGVKYDLVVLCHTVDDAESGAIQSQLQQGPEMVPVYSMTAFATPLEFIKAVSRLTGKRALVVRE